jgi:hypothetical protein
VALRLPMSLRSPTISTKRAVLGVVSALVIASAAVADPKPVTRHLKPDLISVTATPIAGFDRVDRSKSRFGALQWRGGLVLSAPLAAFGGWSGLVVDADGQTFVAVSDAGAWMTGTLKTENGLLSGLDDVRLGPLTALGGRSLTGGRYRDAEAVSLASGTLKAGDLLISFEQKNRIGKFRISKDGLAAPTEYFKMPAEFAKKRGTDGIEAVTVMRTGPLKGQTIAFAEAIKTKGGHRAGWIWAGKEPRGIALTDIGDYNVTDIAGLPGGDLMVLERRFRWTEGVKVRLRRVAAAEIKPGAVLAGEVVLEADLGQEIDNLEGLAVHTSASGETILTLISDDNFNRFLQRTILLQFALTNGPEQAEK